MNFSEIKKVISDAAKATGIDEYDVYYSVSSDISAETLKSEISGFSSSESIGIGFRCIVDGKFGQASCEYITKSELENLVLKAYDNAKYIESDDESIIYSGAESYKEVCGDCFDLPGAGDIRNVALAIQKRSYEENSLVVDGTQSSAGACKVEVHMFNSYGLELHKTGGCVSYGSYPVVSNGNESEDSYETKMSKTFDNIDEVARVAVEKAVCKLGSDSIPGGKYNIVLSGKKFATFLAEFSGCFSAKNVKLGLSALKGKIGEKVASDIITIVDDPFSAELMAQNPFDGEGVATYTKNVIENGVLKTYFYDLAMAKHFGVAPTGNASRGYSSPVAISPYFLYVKPGNKKFDELIKDVGEGIYVTELKSFSASNAVTGDFSIESCGYRISGGKLGEYVKSFTIAGNFFELIKNVEDISNELEVKHNGIFRGYAAPAIFVKNISVAGK